MPLQPPHALTSAAPRIAASAWEADRQEAARPAAVVREELPAAMHLAREALLTLLLEHTDTAHWPDQDIAPDENPARTGASAGTGKSMVAMDLQTAGNRRPQLLQLLRTAERLENLLDRHCPGQDQYCRDLRTRRLCLAKLRQDMIAGNFRLVGFIACRYHSNLGFEDLLQEGNVGLIKAVDRFDPGRGIRFSTYAVFWIRQAISRLIIKQEKSVRLPVPLAEKAATVYEILRKTHLENGHWPSVMEIQDRCGLSADDINMICRYYLATNSLEAAQENGQTLLDGLKQQQFRQPLHQLIDDNLRTLIAHVVAELPDKESTILVMRFGLRNHSEMTLQAIAEQLHLTRERVRQIQNQALSKLKLQFAGELQPFLDSNDD